MKFLKALCFTLILLFSNKSYSQFLFNINHLQDGDSALTIPWGLSILDTYKDTIKLNIGVISGSINGYAKSVTYNLVNDTTFLLFNRLDGTITNSEYYPISGSMIPINDSVYVSGCSYIHFNGTTQDTAKSGLIYFNKNGDTLYSRWFGANLRFILNGFKRIDDRLFLMGRFFDNSTGYNKAYLVKTDLMGNLIWARKYFSNPLMGNANADVCKISNNGYFLCGLYNVYDVGPIHYGDCGIYKLDTNGNKLWYKKLFNNSYGGCFKVEQASNAQYFLSGNLDTLIHPTDYPHNGYIAKIDSNANVLWLHVFNEIPHILKNMWQYRVLPDGDLIFCGERLEAIGTGVHVGWLCRMDSSGNIKWEHYYKQNDSSEYNCLAEVQQMPDGGFMATGTCRDSITRKQSAWLIRTDSNGCLIPGCVAPNAIEVFPEETIRFSLYPNPCNGVFMVESTSPMETDAILSLYDITGKLLHKQTIRKGVYKTLISFQQASGLYLLSLTDQQGKQIYTNKIQLE